MTSASAARRAVTSVVVCCVLAATAAAQSWNDARTRALVERATARRTAQIADSALVAYSATANGYVTFLGQIGEGMHLPPKVIRTDQLALKVYWRAPGLSKQVIIGRRDTLLLPTDIQYHMDHLGVVQGNLPNVIRLGEGDEVKDVPHPLSAAGLMLYDFAITDSLTLRAADRTVRVYEVQVRPKDEDQARVVGAVYLEMSSAQVVRMTLSFTRAAYLDSQLEDISIVLENALVEGRFWLPHRQELELRRSGTWLKFPARGIIRGRWEICCYVVNVAVPRQAFAGPEIVSDPPRELAAYKFPGKILDSLPADAAVATDADVARVQEEAREMIAASALETRAGASLYARRLSDFARVNRVEGLALGAGGAWQPAPSLGVALLARYGLADDAAKAALAVRWTLPHERWFEPYVERSYHDAGDVEERSLVVNSLSSQEYGSDFTDPFDVRAAGLKLGLGAWHRVRFTLAGSYEDQSALAVHAVPFNGAYGPTLPAWPLREWLGEIRAEREWVLDAVSSLRVDATISGGWITQLDTSVSPNASRFARAFAEALLSRAIGADRLVSRTTLGFVSPSAAPAQDQVLLGGPITGPGYAYHQFAAAFGASQHLEWRLPVPFWSLPIGAFGRTPASFTLAPYAHVVYVDRSASFVARAEGWYPSAGLGASFFFDLLRVDIARGFRAGTWYFGVDLAHDLWSVL